MWFVRNRRAPRPRRVPIRGLGRAGSATLEFAVVAPVFLMLLVGGMEVARYLTLVQSLRELTADGARQALIAYNTYLINGTNPWSVASVVANVPILNAAQVTLVVTPRPPACSSQHLITVTASYPFTSVTSLFSSMNGSLNAANFTTQISC